MASLKELPHAVRYEDHGTKKLTKTMTRGFIVMEKCHTTLKGEFHDQGDAKWIVIMGKLRGHNDTPFGRLPSGRIWWFRLLSITVDSR
jgi:hypothetical protein